MSKLWIGLVVAMCVCYARASFNKFGELGTGEEGYYKHCFTKMSLGNLIDAYYKQPVGDSLKLDRKEVEAKLDTEFAAYGQSEGCSRYCFKQIVPQEVYRLHPGERAWDTSICQRYARFSRLCKLMNGGKSGDVRIVAIEKWLCLTSKALEESLYSSYLKCRDITGYPGAFEREADMELRCVKSYTLERLREKQQEFSKEIEASNKLRKELDEKIFLEAYSKVNLGIDRLPEYIACSKRELSDRVQEEKVRVMEKLARKRRSKLH